MIYLGIDPGLSGAVAVIHPDERVELFDVPTVKAQRGEDYAPGAMAELLVAYRLEPGRTAFCAIEMVEAPRGRPDQGELARKGVGSQRTALKIGYGRGLWVGLLAAYQIAYETTLPRVWKKSFGLIEADKKASRAKACELFPQLRGELIKRRPDFSEALLLAEWARRRRSNG